MKSTRVWFSTRQAAEEIGRHPDTIRRALEAGDLHGGQRKRNASWLVHRDCLTAYALGEPCPHSQQRHLTAV